MEQGVANRGYLSRGFLSSASERCSEPDLAGYYLKN